MDYSATSPAARIFARSIRRPTGKPNAKTRSFPTFRRGSTRARITSLNCTKSRWNSNTYIRLSGVTNNEPGFVHLAPEEYQRARENGPLRGEEPECGHVGSGDARRVERRVDPQRRGAGRFRSRLPRRHLRFLRIHDQWRRSRPHSRNHGLSTHSAALPRWAETLS